jgi:membrane protein YdbS with pleckstrin-like domain
MVKFINSSSTKGSWRSMYCYKCGEPVPDTSRFCNHCGSQVGTALAGNTVSALAAEEEEVFAIRPTMIFVWIRYIVAVLVVIAVAAVMGVLSNKYDRFGGMVAFLVILAAAIVAFAFPIYRHILRFREVYVLTTHKLEMRFGLIAKIVRNIPLSKIQDVTVTASVWQRLLKLGDIEIDSASEGGKIVLDDIHFPDRYSNLILAELRRRN